MKLWVNNRICTETKKKCYNEGAVRLEQPHSIKETKGITGGYL